MQSKPINYRNMPARFIVFLSFLLLICISQTEAGIPPLGKEQIEQYVETIRNDQDPAARLKAVIALHENYIYGRIWIEVGRGGELYHPSYLKEIVQLFEGEMDFKVKLALGIFCAKMGDRTAVPFLVSALEQETYPVLGYDKTPFSLEGGIGDVPYTQWHILRALQKAGDGRANVVLTKLYDRTKKEVALAQSEADRSGRSALLGLVARAMVSTGSVEAIGILVKELQDVKGEALTCDQVSVRAVALGSKRALEKPEVRQVLIALLRKSSCEQVREFVAGALGSVRDNPQVHQILFEGSYDDAALSVRKSAIVALWSDPDKPHVVNSYLKHLTQETDPKRQQQLLDDYRSLQENWNPLPTEFIQNFQTIKKDFTNEKIRESISEILGIEREKALTSYEQQLDYRDKGYGIYPDYVRAGYIDSIRLFLPSLSSREIKRIQALSQRETNPELQNALFNLLEEYQILQKKKEKGTVPKKEQGY